MLGILAASAEPVFHTRSEYFFHARMHMSVGGAWDCPYSLLDAVKAHPDDNYWVAVGARVGEIWVDLKAFDRVCT